jgi:uncharacterized membrane protein
VNRTALWCLAAAIVLVMILTGLVFTGSIRPPKQQEEWNLTRFRSEIIKGNVSNGELSDNQFTGQTKKGHEFTVNLPKASDGQSYWVNLLTDHGVVIKVRTSAFWDMLGTVAVSFILPIGFLIAAVLLVVFIFYAFVRR